MSAYDEIKHERAYQTAKWGVEQDDINTPYNWAAYISAYASRSLIGDPTLDRTVKFRADMVKVAALAVAAMEAIDRAIV